MACLSWACGTLESVLLELNAVFVQDIAFVFGHKNADFAFQGGSVLWTLVISKLCSSNL